MNGLVTAVFACFFLHTGWLMVKAEDNAEGPVALITGGSTGIGLATAQVLVFSGYRVVITSRSEKKLRAAAEDIEAEIEAHGLKGRVDYCQQDVTNDEDYDKCFDFAAERFGPVENVFLNAGTALDLSIPFVNQTRSDLRKVVDVNFVSVMIGLQKSIQVMLENGRGGSIVLCSSILAGANKKWFDGRFGNIVAHGMTYSTSKAALDFMARAAVYYAPQNIRVYSLRPNTYFTPLIKNPSRSAGINLFFNTQPGDPADIGHIVEHFFDGTTQWPTGSSVICDHDATIDGYAQTSQIDRPDLDPGAEMQAAIFSQLRGYDGGPYKCRSSYTCNFVEEYIKTNILSAESQEKKEL